MAARTASVPAQLIRSLVAVLAVLAGVGIGQGASAQSSADASPQVIVVEDNTYTYGCEIDRKAMDPSGTIVLSETTEACPPGSNLHTYITTEDDAVASGLAYAYVTGDPAVDAQSAATLHDSLRPAAQAHPASTQSCSYQRYIATGSIYIVSRDAYVSTTVDYAEDEDCYGRIYTATQSFAGEAVYWRSAYYDYPVSPPTAFIAPIPNCPTIGTNTQTYYASDGSYGWKVNLGGGYQTEIEDLYGCTQWGNSYTGYVYV